MIPQARHPLSEWIEGLLGLVFPAVCQICGGQRSGSDDGFVCEQCWTEPGALRFIRTPYCQRCGLPYDGELTAEFTCSNCTGVKLHFSFARSAVVAARLVKDVVHRFKYNGHVWFDAFLANVLFREFRPWFDRSPGWDCIIPVPLHPCKQRERGFNQSERIARRIGERMDIECLPGAVRRVKATDTQTHLSREQRAINMRKAFATTGRHALNGRRAILLDDVFTTGATTNACARVLRQAGVTDVCVWTVARGV